MAEKTEKNVLSAVAAVVVIAGFWSYWPILKAVESVWSRVPDYSHGYLVAPIAGYLLWSRRDKLPKNLSPSLLGFGLVLVGLAVRWVGNHYYLEPVEQGSLILWIAGVVWLLGGFWLLVWALPGVLFLVFMFPMPFSLETSFSLPLQRVATSASCWMLQSLGQPAFATGNVINLGEHKIEVVQACSGLRMLMGFLALCVAYALLCDRSPWEKALIVISSVPIAILCNILRITFTGLLYQYASAEWAHKFTHDAAGYAMMPVALLFLAAALWYFDRLFVPAEVASSPIRVSK